MTKLNVRLSKLEMLECQRLDAECERLRKELYALLDQDESTPLAQEFVANEEIRALSDEELDAHIQLADANKSLSDKHVTVALLREWIATQRAQMRAMEDTSERMQHGHQ